MKSKSFRLLYFIPIAILLLSSCSNGISNDAIKTAIFNEENCLKACDEKADKALTEFENCIKPYKDKLQTALNVCSHVPPANREECERKAFENFTADIDKCLADYKAKMEDVKKCRKNCRDMFPLELKIK